MYIVMLGVPGAGKGTQAKRLSAALKIPHVSSGEIFRQNFNEQTELGVKANEFLAEGQLVPDEITIAMVRDRLHQEDATRGAILDGFPRTRPQAEALEEITRELDSGIDHVLHIQLEVERLLQRMEGRRVCREQGHVYHLVHQPPLNEGVCDIDGSELYRRNDDLPETVMRRVDVYQQQTEPLIDYYRDRGLLVEINGAQTLEEVGAEILSALGIRTAE